MRKLHAFFAYLWALLNYKFWMFVSNACRWFMRKLRPDITREGRAENETETIQR